MRCGGGAAALAKSFPQFRPEQRSGAGVIKRTGNGERTDAYVALVSVDHLVRTADAVAGPVAYPE
jgi:hypothetical protein